MKVMPTRRFKLLIKLAHGDSGWRKDGSYIADVHSGNLSDAELISLGVEAAKMGRVRITDAGSFQTLLIKPREA